MGESARPPIVCIGGGAEPGQHVPCVAADAALMHALLQFNNNRFCNAGETADSCGIRPALCCVALHQVLMLHLAQHFVLQNY